ncbi:MAG: hypothetical protein GWO02_18665 [Gammaproteobacteria bacterium]|nr:hypothetical protein [Gammaproteobacteria bacterium]
MRRPPQYLLRRPFVPGTRWTARGRVALLRRNLPLFRLEAEASLPLTRSVAAADEVVEVPAGRYSGCLRVEGRGAVRFESEALGVVTVEVTVTDWFAPGVGLVKSVREERPDSQALGEGRAVMELEALMR